MATAFNDMLLQMCVRFTNFIHCAYTVVVVNPSTRHDKKVKRTRNHVPTVIRALPSHESFKHHLKTYYSNWHGFITISDSPHLWLKIFSRWCILHYFTLHVPGVPSSTANDHFLSQAQAPEEAAKRNNAWPVYHVVSQLLLFTKSYCLLIQF